MEGRKRFDPKVDTFIYLILIAISLLFIYPFVYVISASFSDPNAVLTEPLLVFPKAFTMETYRMVLSVNTIYIGYMNSAIYTFFGTLLNIVVTLMAAYALSQSNLPGKRIVLFLIVATLFFYGGLIPTYLIVKELGMVNTRFAIVVVSAVSAWNLLITRAYISSNIPHELHDAADIDGAGEWTFFSKIVLPLSKPIIAVIALFYGSAHWNGYFNALIYLRERELFPLQLFLREILLLEQMNDMLGSTLDRVAFSVTIKYVVLVVSILPLLVIFPFVQRYFVKGALIGSLKE